MAERNIGVLPMNEKYTVLGVDYSDDATCVCENCGRAIKNITEIQNSKGKKFCVGIDCADTLSSAEISNNWEYQDMKKSHNRLLTQLAKVAKTVKTGKFTILFDLSMGLYLYDRPVDVWGIRFLTNDRVFGIHEGKQRAAFINTVLKRYNGLIKIVPNLKESDGGYSSWRAMGINI